MVFMGLIMSTGDWLDQIDPSDYGSQRVMCPHCQRPLDVPSTVMAPLVICPRCRGRFPNPTEIPHRRDQVQAEMARAVEHKPLRVPTGIACLLLVVLGVLTAVAMLAFGIFLTQFLRGI